MPLAGIHLGWAMWAPPRRTLCQNDWPRTTQKLIPSPWNLSLRAMRQSRPLGSPCPTALCRGILSSVSTGVPSDNWFPSVRQAPPFRPWKWSEVKVTQSCPTLYDPMDYTVHGILQARILEWVAFPFSRDLPNPGIEPRSPTLQGDSLPAEPQGSPSGPGRRPLSCNRTRIQLPFHTATLDLLSYCVTFHSFGPWPFKKQKPRGGGARSRHQRQREVP